MWDIEYDIGDAGLFYDSNIQYARPDFEAWVFPNLIQ